MKLKKISAVCMAAAIISGVAPAMPQYVPGFPLTASAEVDGNGDEYTLGTYEDLKYRKYSDHIFIYNSLTKAETLDIPAKIDGLPVTVLGGLGHCENLKSVTIPEGVTAIRDYALNDCLVLEDISIPSTVTEIGFAAFGRTPWLEKQRAENPFVIINDILYIEGNCTGAIAIPDGVRVINNSAFDGNDDLTAVTIPESVEYIGNWAFGGCSNLRSVTIKNPDCEIDDTEYTFCNGSVTLNNEVKGYFTGTICGCEGSTAQTYAEKYGRKFEVIDTVMVDGNGDEYTLGTYEDLKYRKYSDHIDIYNSLTKAETLDIPAKIDGLPVTAITGLGRGENLKSLTIPEGVTTIGEYAFRYCEKLETISISSTVTEIGFAAFGATPWLEKQRAENPFVIINDILYIYGTCTGDVVIPDGVKKINQNAFTNNDDITSVTLPESVEEIGSWAFGECDILTSVTIMNPDCEIFDLEYTICNGFKDLGNQLYESKYNGSISGYEGSTAQAYAEKYGRTFKSLGTATYTLGDTNGDGAIDATDASNILAVYAKLSTDLSAKPTQKESSTCDVNKDGGIDATDASTVLAYYAYTSTESGNISFEEFMNKE